MSNQRPQETTTVSVPASYLDYVLKNRSVAFLYIAWMVVVILTLQSAQVFTLTALLTVALFYYKSTQASYEKWRTTRETFKANIAPTELVLENVYKVHKSPKTFKYILKHDDVLSVLHTLRFMRNYDAAGFDKITVLSEAFFKEYDRMIQRREDYPCDSHFPVLVDVRTELLNEISRAHYNVPERYTNTIDIAARTMQSITYKVIKVMAAKCNKWGAKTAFLHKPPFAMDPRKESHQLF
jgi:hypothetical protein